MKRGFLSSIIAFLFDYLMTYQEQKRPLPPTPNSGSSINYSKLLENMPIVLDTNYECMTEREQKLYNEVLNCYKVMEKKDVSAQYLVLSNGG